MINYSIIIPTKNIPDLLDRCISSIPRRSDVEVIVVDDNSDEGIVDFTNYPGVEYPCLKLIRTHEGKGAGYVRNQGLLNAKGEWVIFADSDDFFNDCFNEVLDDSLDSAADIIFFDVDSRYSDTLEPADRNELLSNAIKQALDTGDTTFMKYSNACYTPWGKIIRHDLISNNHILFDEVIAANDLMFSLKCGHFAQQIEVDSRKAYCITTRRGSLWQNRSSIIMRSRMGSWCRANDFMYSVGNLDFRKNLFTVCHVYMRNNIKDYFWALGQAFIHTPVLRIIPDLFSSIIVICKRGISFVFKKNTREKYYQRQKYTRP